jgi:uncharacterized protein
MEHKRELKKVAKKAVAKTVGEKKAVTKKATTKKVASKVPPRKATARGEKAAAVWPSTTTHDFQPMTPPSTPVTEAAPAALPPQGYWQDRYGEDRIVLMIRDPYWCFTYWDLTTEKQAEAITQISDLQAKLLLRVYDVTGLDFNGSNAHRFMDIEISTDASNWYINVWAADRAYCVDLGLLYPDGRFVTLARSNVVTTPRDTVSSVIDEEWMVVDETFDRMYKTAGGDEWGRSSEAITKYMLKRVRADVSSGGLASMGSEGGRPRVKGPEDFWLVVNTELIVYGATEPDAKVTIQGNPIRLNEDGTFSVRYALPDGKQEIPVKAVSASGTQERQITPIVEKRTE